MEMKYVSILLLGGSTIGLMGCSALAADPSAQSHSTGLRAVR